MLSLFKRSINIYCRCLYLCDGHWRYTSNVLVTLSAAGPLTFFNRFVNSLFNLVVIITLDVAWVVLVISRCLRIELLKHFSFLTYKAEVELRLV